MNNIAGVTTGCRRSDVGNRALTNRKYSNYNMQKMHKLLKFKATKHTTMSIMKIFTVNTKDFCSRSETTVTVLVFVKITFNYSLSKNTFVRDDEQPAPTYSSNDWQGKMPRNQKPN